MRIVLLSCLVFSLAVATESAQLYQRVEVAMANATVFANPFTDTELRLDVQAPSARPLGSAFTWYGFHDGDGVGGQSGKVWKFRLLFDHPGTWTVTAGFFKPGTTITNGPSQTFTWNVSASKVAGEHGHVYRDPNDWRRYRHADGTPWVPFPIHASMLLDRPLSAAQEWIDEHVSRGVNAMSVRFHAEAYGLGEDAHFHYLLTNGARTRKWPANGESDFDFTRFDVAAWRHNEAVLSYAETKQLKLFIWFGISGINAQYKSYGARDWSGSTLGQQQRLLIRYLLARWGTMTTWWHWTVNSEWEESNKRDLEIAYAKALRDGNPWRTLITDHSLRDWTLGGASEGWDTVTLQKRVANTDIGATDCRSFVTANAKHGLPVFNCEGVWMLSTSTRTRIASMTHIMAGGYSHVAHDGSNHWNSSWGANWSTVTLRHQQDADIVGSLARFFNGTTGVDINGCEPSHDLASVSGGNLALCLAASGDRYYLWLDRGGSATIDLSAASGSFSVVRYQGANLTTSTSLSDLSGGAVRSLPATPTSGFGNDWLYVIRRKGTAASVTVTAPNGGEQWSAGGTGQVVWSSSGAIANVAIDLSTNGGSTWSTLVSNTANDGSETIAVPDITTTTARIRVRDATNSAIHDHSDATFTIIAASDTTAPAVVISDPKANAMTGRTVTARGSASDGSGIAKIEYRLDSGIWKAANGTTSWSVDLASLSHGEHTIEVRATDASANANISAIPSRSFSVDAQAPVLAAIAVDAQATSATITWTTDEPADSRVQWGTASGVYEGESGVVETGVTSHAVTIDGLSAGTAYVFIIICADAFDNATVSAEQSFTTASTGSGRFLESGGLLVMEAEHATGSARNGDSLAWKTASALGGSVGDYVTTDNFTSSPVSWAVAAELTYDVRIATAGTYSVWMRRTQVDGGSNSAWFGVDGAQVGAEFDNRGGNGWQWIKHSATVSLSTGDHIIQLRRREDGYAVDRLLLTRDAGFTPTGNGPAESARSGGPGGDTGFAVSINFQPASAPIPTGWLVDGGAVYGSRGGGLTYGWKLAASGDARDRNNTNAPDQVYDTLNHLQKRSGQLWELAVPDGRYAVRIICGDPSFTDQINHLDIEGVAVRDPDGQDRFDEYTIEVEVRDGRLTIRPANDSINAKLVAVEVATVVSSGG